MWKAISGYEGLYEVSDEGLVRSVDRRISGRSIKGRILSAHNSGKGYPAVALSKNGIVRTTYVHMLVANTFINKPNSIAKLVVNHKDGNKWNNTVDNLEWVSYSQNNVHAYNTGLKQRGHGFYNAILTEEDVQEIRKLGKYDTYERIANKYGITKASVRDVLIGKTWKYITNLD